MVGAGPIDTPCMPPNYSFPSPQKKNICGVRNLSSWWLNHPLEKYQSKWESSPGRGENKKNEKPPPRCVIRNLDLDIQMPCELKRVWGPPTTKNQIPSHTRRHLTKFCQKDPWFLGVEIQIFDLSTSLTQICTPGNDHISHHLEKKNYLQKCRLDALLCSKDLFAVKAWVFQGQTDLST